MNKLITILIFMLLSITTIAQQGINYKALVKDGNGNLVTNQNITIEFRIFQGQGVSETIVYQETQEPTTDANGIIITTIGNDSSNILDINWGADNHFLNVQIDIGEGLIDMGTTQFMAVPYALHAKTVDFSYFYADKDNDGFGDNWNLVFTNSPPNGFISQNGDCNDLDSEINPDATEIIEDGIDQNCNGDDDEWVDNDGDGYTTFDDCDDNEPSIFPGAPELCDGIANDCSNPNWPNIPTDETDDDGDGFTECEGDCDDTQKRTYPGADEICGDGLDNDCDGEIDEVNCIEPNCLLKLADLLECARVNCYDNFGDFDCLTDSCPDLSSEALPCLDITCMMDLGNQGLLSFALWDALGLTNEEIAEQLLLGCGGLDEDQDGYSPINGDCNDYDNTIYPGANDICGDGIDQDCSGSDALCNDNDLDGYVDVNFGGDDCDDNNSSIHPSAPEYCDGLDNNCDGEVDNIISGENTEAILYLDSDSDGFGDPNHDFIIYACPPVQGYVTNPDDCDDNNPNINPGADEICDDSIDNNCDGQIDEGCNDCSFDNTGGQQITSELPLIYQASNASGTSILSIEIYDSRGVGTYEITSENYEICTLCILIHEDDGLGTIKSFLADSGTIEITSWDTNFSGMLVNATFIEVTIDYDTFVSTPVEGGEIRCVNNYLFDAIIAGSIDNDEDGYSINDGDCNDNNPEINPGMGEITCNGIDDDCNPATLDNPDSDGDGFSYCEGDCNDADPDIYPGAPELCDNIDNDCNGQIDDNISSPLNPIQEGVCAGSTQVCIEGIWYEDYSSNPNYEAVEVTCDGLDNDCDGEVDEGCDLDNDQDGFTENDGDCDDTNSNIYPGADEICGDGIDNNCDGLIDDEDCACNPLVGTPCDGYDSDSCQEGVFICDGYELVCTDNTGSSVEICDNGLDDDCDGVIDEGCGTLVINEVDYDQPNADNADFIELYNTSSSPINLSGWEVVLINGADGVPYYSETLLSGVIDSGGYYVLGTTSLFPPPDYFFYVMTNTIQNGPDAIYLRNPYGNIVDALSYEGSIGQPWEEGSPSDGDPSTDYSIGRYPDGNDTNDNSVDFILMPKTPGSPNIQL